MIRFLLAALCFSSLAFAQADTDEEKVQKVLDEKPTEFRASCRKVLHGAFRIDEFDGWQIVSNDMKSTLDGISISHKRDTDPPDAHPDDYKKKGIRSGKIKLPGHNNWLVCHHTKMKVVVERQIPEGLSVCTLKEKSDAIAVVCR